MRSRNRRRTEVGMMTEMRPQVRHRNPAHEKGRTLLESSLFYELKATGESVDNVVHALYCGTYFDHVLNLVGLNFDHPEHFFACGQTKVECLAIETIRIAFLDDFADGLVELFVAHNASVGHGQEFGIDLLYSVGFKKVSFHKTATRDIGTMACPCLSSPDTQCRA